MESSELEKNKEIAIEAFNEFLIDICFVFLPFIVITLCSIHKNNFSLYNFSSEISFASSILFGQSIVNMVRATGANTNGKRLASSIAVLLVIGVVPSMVLLAINQISEQKSLFVLIIQCLLFFLSILALYLSHFAKSRIDKLPPIGEQISKYLNEKRTPITSSEKA